jgi:hypothetical protein
MNSVDSERENLGLLIADLGLLIARKPGVRAGWFKSSIFDQQ